MTKLWLKMGLLFVLALSLPMTLTACGDDSSSGDGGVQGDGDGDGDSDAGDGDGDGDIAPVSEMITAADGGEISTVGADLAIPAGALDDDTSITVEVILADDLPESESLGSLVYDFGPDGTTFNEPVTLTIELNSSVPSGMEASIAWLDEETDTWVALEDSRVVGETVVGSTDHFTAFAIVLTAAGQTAGGCEELDFSACGGDVTGTWTFDVACADITAESIFGADNPFADCAELVFSATVDLTGTITLEDDATYSSEQNLDVSIMFTFPRSCVSDAPCSQFESADNVVTEDGDTCTISTGGPMMKSEMGTYELDGDTLITTDSEGVVDEPAEYCIAGDVLTVRTVDIDEETGAETIVFFQATRQ